MEKEDSRPFWQIPWTEAYTSVAFRLFIMSPMIETQLL